MRLSNWASATPRRRCWRRRSLVALRTESFTLDARFHLLAVPIDLVGCEVAISVIDHLELAATDGDEGIGERRGNHAGKPADG